MFRSVTLCIYILDYGFWTYIANYWYNIIDSSLSFEEAISTCNIKGGVLYESPDRATNNEVTDMAYAAIGDSLIWLGIINPNEDENFLYASNNQSLLWTNWWNQSSDPRGDCILMSTDTGRWIDVNCTEETQQAICVSNDPVNGDAAIVDGKILLLILDIFSYG